MNNRQETHQDFEVNSYSMCSFDPICVFTTAEVPVSPLTPTKIRPLTMLHLFTLIRSKEKRKATPPKHSLTLSQQNIC